MNSQPVSRGTLTIAIEACKGCELCITACPPGVLAMSSGVNEMGYRYPILHQGCTGCTACQMVCPDYVFDVFRRPRTGDDGAAVAGSEPADEGPAGRSSGSDSRE